MKKISLIVTAVTMLIAIATTMVYGDADMAALVFVIFSYWMLSYYTELLICLKCKKAYLKFLPLIYVAVGAAFTMYHYVEESLFFPQLSLIFFGIPTLLGIVYIVLGYFAAKKGK